ncbi:MAG: nicotinate phosphoribosyltransferase [Candidatus Levyibacteriota bacterium]
MENNIILMTDSYKVTHWHQYPPKTQYIYLYFESRGGQWDEIVFFGLQYILKQYLVGKVVSKKKIEEAEKIFSKHFNNPAIFNKEGWLYILREHAGKLPIVIKAVQEGTVVNNRNVLLTVENTDPECFWLTSYIETVLSQIWYPCTIATQSREMKKTIRKYLKETGNPTMTENKLVDFGYRGSSSHESASIGGAAHLVNFKTSENLAAIRLLRKYYNVEMPSHAVPANEHSTVISWGEKKEIGAYKNMLEKFTTGMIIIVCDSYDIFNACRKILGEQLSGDIKSHKGTIFLRPDSGNPINVIPQILRVLGDKFGYIKNEKGYKILPSYLRIIQGDGISYETIDKILKAIKSSGWSIDNIALGSGGGLLQKVNRDTLKFVFNCSNVIIDGVSVDVFKDPIGSDKKSKSGRFALVMKDGKLVTRQEKKVEFKSNKLKTVFKNGDLINNQSFEEIKNRAVI